MVVLIHQRIRHAHLDVKTGPGSETFHQSHRYKTIFWTDAIRVGPARVAVEMEGDQ